MLIKLVFTNVFRLKFDWKKRFYTTTKTQKQHLKFKDFLKHKYYVVLRLFKEKKN